MSGSSAVCLARLFSSFVIPGTVFNVEDPTMRQPRSPRTRAGRVRPRTRLHLEALEDRTLLTLFLPGFAVPGYEVYHPAGAAAPLASAGPTGYTPGQVRHAYGFDQISLPGGVPGDGSGTTIAIVDAYDDPTIASDLHQFDVQFGLSDPSFTKVNQSGGTTWPVADTGWSDEISLDVEWAHAV